MHSNRSCTTVDGGTTVDVNEGGTAVDLDEGDTEDVNEGDRTDDSFVTKHVDASTMTDEWIKKMHIFNEENLCNDDKMVKFYTGFSSFKTLWAVYTYVSKDIVHGSQAALILVYNDP